jgi:F-type H+-transporting ATPase subunit delta
MAELATIARPYAEAAFRIALEGNGLERWSDTLALLDAAVSDEALAPRLQDPNVSDAALESVLLGLIDASFIIGVGLAMLFAFGNPLLAVVS